MVSQPYEMVEQTRKYDKIPAWGGIWEIVWEAGWGGMWLIALGNTKSGEKDKAFSIGLPIFLTIMSPAIVQQVRAIGYKREAHQFRRPLPEESGYGLAQPLRTGRFTVQFGHGPRFTDGVNGIATEWTHAARSLEEEACLVEVVPGESGRVTIPLAGVPATCLVGEAVVTYSDRPVATVSLAKTPSGRQARAIYAGLEQEWKAWEEQGRKCPQPEALAQAAFPLVRAAAGECCRAWREERTAKEWRGRHRADMEAARKLSARLESKLRDERRGTSPEQLRTFLLDAEKVVDTICGLPEWQELAGRITHLESCSEARAALARAAAPYPLPAGILELVKMTDSRPAALAEMAREALAKKELADLAVLHGHLTELSNLEIAMLMPVLHSVTWGDNAPSGTLLTLPELARTLSAEGNHLEAFVYDCIFTVVRIVMARGVAGTDYISYTGDSNIDSLAHTLNSARDGARELLARAPAELERLAKAVQTLTAEEQRVALIVLANLTDFMGRAGSM